MSEEIKEILDMLKDSLYIPSDDNRTYKLLDRDDVRHLLDYITSLQNRITELEEINKQHEELNGKLREENKELKEYKENATRKHWQQKCAEHCINEKLLQIRINKAIDKTQYIIDYGFDYDGFNTVESLKGLIDMLVNYARETKNILQDKEEV